MGIFEIFETSDEFERNPLNTGIRSFLLAVPSKYPFDNGDARVAVISTGRRDNCDINTFYVMASSDFPHKNTERRLGDTVVIDGGYQHRALTSGPPAQRFWHQSKLNLLDWIFRVNRGDRVLDVGCGSGVFSDAMAKRGANVLGIDANERAVDYALETFSRAGGASFRKGFLDELALDRASFDKAVCLEVIEHVYPNQVQKLFSDLFEILKTKGQLYVTTPNYRGLWPLVEWAADRFSPVAKMDAEQHITHFNRRSLKDALQKSGFEVLEIRTFSTFAPFVSPLSWRAAEQLEHVERQVNLPFGNVLAAVARKP